MCVLSVSPTRPQTCLTARRSPPGVTEFWEKSTAYTIASDTLATPHPGGERETRKPRPQAEGDAAGPRRGPRVPWPRAFAAARRDACARPPSTRAVAPRAGVAACGRAKAPQALRPCTSSSPCAGHWDLLGARCLTRAVMRSLACAQTRKYSTLAMPGSEVRTSSNASEDTAFWYSCSDVGQKCQPPRTRPAADANALVRAGAHPPCERRGQRPFHRVWPPDAYPTRRHGRCALLCRRLGWRDAAVFSAPKSAAAMSAQAMRAVRLPSAMAGCPELVGTAWPCCAGVVRPRCSAAGADAPHRGALLET